VARRVRPNAGKLTAGRAKDRHPAGWPRCLRVDVQNSLRERRLPCCRSLPDAQAPETQPRCRPITRLHCVRERCRIGAPRLVALAKRSRWRPSARRARSRRVRARGRRHTACASRRGWLAKSFLVSACRATTHDACLGDRRLQPTRSEDRGQEETSRISISPPPPSVSTLLLVVWWLMWQCRSHLPGSRASHSTS
jgi:hypothetical protein